ncbi:hypothetical protein AALA36_21880 [Lachnospiraceae bacterium 66-29]
MKKISEKIRSVFDKVPVVAYALKSFIISFFIAAVVLAVLFAILWQMGIYAELEAALDLKYNSPFIVAPMWTFAALFLICLMVGFLMYFHKYKRGKAKTDFYKAVAPALRKK